MSDVFVHDLTTRRTVLVSTDLPGDPTLDQYSWIPDISEDGRHVAYTHKIGAFDAYPANFRVRVAPVPFADAPLP